MGCVRTNRESRTATPFIYIPTTVRGIQRYLTMSSDLSAGPEWALPVRLLSSVAVVGRDNEPIYLRGDLCDCVSSPKSSPAASPNKAGERMDTGEDASAVGHEASTEGETSPSNKKRGIFGRIKGAMGKTSAADGGEKEELDGDDTDVPDEASNDDDLDTDDPFGFFGSTTIHDGNSKPHLSIGNFSGIPNPMTLTQQLVLHASLDRFEEMASRSNKGGAVRWRTPGSTGANAMWMGLLCEVEERWTVYGGWILSNFNFLSFGCIFFHWF